MDVYRKLRNQANRLRRDSRGSIKLFNHKLNELKIKGSCRKWWSDIKSICGLSDNKQGDLSNVIIIIIIFIRKKCAENKAEKARDYNYHN